MGRQPAEEAELVEPSQRRHALFRRLAKADARIEHNIFFCAMSALAAISSVRPENAVKSCMCSSIGSTLSRLCITTTGTSWSAMTRAMSGSRCNPHTFVGNPRPLAERPRCHSCLHGSMETGRPRRPSPGHNEASAIPLPQRQAPRHREWDFGPDVENIRPF